MKKLVILTGAGMSAESGISTFRDSTVREKYRVEGCSPRRKASPPTINWFSTSTTSAEESY